MTDLISLGALIQNELNRLYHRSIRDGGSGDVSNTALKFFCVSIEKRCRQRTRMESVLK